MFFLGDNDWIRYGWGKDLLGSPSVSEDCYFDISNIKYGIEPAKAAIDAIISISKTYPPPYNLFLSGGVDSQVMLLAWMNSGIPFNAISCQYVDDNGKIFNNHDLLTLDVFAGKHSIDIEYHQFNIFDFLENNLYSYARKYFCTSPHMCTYMAMSEHVEDGTVLFSGNYIEHNAAWLNYTILGLHRYTKISGRSMIPYFLLHTPELAGAFEPYIRSITALDHGPYYTSKIEVYKNSGFDVIPQLKKLSGFEIIKDYYDKNHDVLPIERIKYSKFDSKRVFDIMFRYRLTEFVRYNDELIFVS